MAETIPLSEHPCGKTEIHEHRIWDVRYRRGEQTAEIVSCSGWLAVTPVFNVLRWLPTLDSFKQAELGTQLLQVCEDYHGFPDRTTTQ